MEPDAGYARGKYQGTAEREAFAARLLADNPDQSMGSLLGAIRREFGKGVNCHRLYELRRQAKSGEIDVKPEIEAMPVNGSTEQEDTTAKAFKACAIKLWKLAQLRGYSGVNITNGKMEVTRTQTVTVVLG